MQRTCWACGTDFTQPHRVGRPAKYCGETCRADARAAMTRLATLEKNAAKEAAAREAWQAKYGEALRARTA